MNLMNVRKLQFNQSLTDRLLSAQASHTAESDHRIDNLLEGLVELLPNPNSVWTLNERVKWLRLAIAIFDLSYKVGDGRDREINIVLDQDSKLLQEEIDVTVPLTDRQLMGLTRVRASVKEISDCESSRSEAAA
jgi:hypothetical protein